MNGNIFADFLLSQIMSSRNIPPAWRQWIRNQFSAPEIPTFAPEDYWSQWWTRQGTQSAGILQKMGQGALSPIGQSAFESLVGRDIDWPKRDITADTLEQLLQTQAKAGPRELMNLIQQGKMSGRAAEVMAKYQKPYFEKAFPKKETVPTGLKARTKELFKTQAKRKTEIRDYQKEFQAAWAKARLEKSDIPDEEGKLAPAYKNIRDFWGEWRINVPKDIRIDVETAIGIHGGIYGKTMGTAKYKKPTVSTSQWTPKQKAYNECRAAGGTVEECKLKAEL